MHNKPDDTKVTEEEAEELSMGFTDMSTCS